MPPDRNSFSPVPSSSSTLTSQQLRDKAAAAASIARGLACLACRKRKVKCDSAKPICSGCYKYAKGDHASISCVYDDVTAPKKKRSSPGTLAALEASNQALRDELDEMKQYMAQMRNAATALPNPPPSTGNERSSHRTVPPVDPFPGYTSVYDRIPLSAALCEAQDPRGSAYSASLDMDLPAAGDHQATRGTASGSHVRIVDLGPTPPDSPSADFWNQLMYPGWPRDLPSFDLTSRLLDVWFSKPHCLTGLINEHNFRASMLHPPSTAAFPHSALIHSMMAIASMFVSDDFFANEPRYWPMDQKVSEYHAARGKVALDQAIAHGQRLLQVSQAVTILCYWAYTSARFVELWLLCGMATRIMTPLGLNQLAIPPTGNTYKMHLLAPPKDDSELFDRSTNCWYAFMSDRMATACTGWAHSLDEADVVSLLPTEAPSALAGDWNSSPLSPKSPSFFLAHPPHLVGPKQLELKAIILLGRVNTFVQRAPLGPQRDDSGYNLTAPDVRKSDAFRKLENDIIGFQASIPREYQSTNAAAVDPRLHIVHSLPPAAMILLHERFVTGVDDSSAPVTLRYAQQVMQVLHSVVSTSFEIGLLSPFMNYVWVVAGRNIVREVAFRMMQNRRDGIEQLRGDVQTILLALHACKTPLATSTAHQLQTLVDDPYRAMPSSPHLNMCPGGNGPTSADPQMFQSAVNGGRAAYNDVELLLRSSYGPSSSSSSSGYVGDSGLPASMMNTPASSSFTPPLSTPSALSSFSATSSSSSASLPRTANGTSSSSTMAASTTTTTSTVQAQPPSSSSNEKTFQEIDDTLTRNGFFGNLGANSFGPELDALIHGSRASAPWLSNSNSNGNPASSSSSSSSLHGVSPTSHATPSEGAGATITSNVRGDVGRGQPDSARVRDGGAGIAARFEELDSADLIRMNSLSEIFGRN